MKAFLLAAGRGTRFRPVTEVLPKPLLPFLNVPIIRAHLARLRSQGVLEAGVNLHHLGHKLEGYLRDCAADLPQLRFFPEPQILGTAGALRNAAGWLAGEDFFVVNTDTAIAPDFRELLARHRHSRRAATLLVVENRQPHRYTPIQPEGDLIKGFGGEGPRPLLYTGVCVLAPRLLQHIPEGETSLVTDLWEPLLRGGQEQIGWVQHEGPFSDLGLPSDFLNASLEALARAGPFPEGSGVFDATRRVLALDPHGDDRSSGSILGDVSIGVGARISDSAVWSGAEIGAGAEISRCLVAGGSVAPGSRYSDALLWPDRKGQAVPHPLRLGS